MEWIDLFAQTGGLEGIDVGSLTPWLSQLWQDFAEWAQRWRQTLDPAIWLVSAILALIPGSFAIYKWWFYRNSRLPQRLEELLNDEETRLKRSRTHLVEIIRKPGPENQAVSPPLFVVPHLANVLRRLNWSRWWSPVPLATAEAELEVALAEIESKKHFCVKSQSIYRDQEATAYLLKGAIAAAKAGRSSKPEEQDRFNRIALNHFTLALEIEPNDLDTLEYVAHQQRILSDLEAALANYKRIVDFTDGPQSANRDRRSRAFRHIGEIYEKQYDRSGVFANLNNAATNLDDAQNCLPDDLRRQLEHAEICEIMGRVAEKKELRIQPGKHYGTALTYYQEIARREPRNSDASSGAKRMIDAIARFQAQQVPSTQAPPSPTVASSINFTR